MTMNENGCKIIYVGDGQDSLYDDVIIVKANLIQNNGFSVLKKNTPVIMFRETRAYYAV